MKLFIKGVSIIFCVLWILFILFEYWVQHPEFSDAMRIFSYGGHVFKLLILGAIGIGGILYFRKTQKLRWINGLLLAVLAIVFMVIMADDFYEVYFGRMLTSPQKLQLIFTLCGTLVPVYLTLLVCFVLGSWCLSLCSFRLVEADTSILAIGIGLCGLTLLLFLLGTMHLLHAYILIPLLLLISGMGWRKSLMFFRRTLIHPIGNIRQFHAVGFIAFYVVFVLICMNMLTAVRPLALGYDAMTLYLKLSALIHDYHGLVQGNLPYNWSLFISLGYLLFDSLPITMTLCFSAYVLCLFALFRLCRKWMESDYAMLCVMLFATMPMTNWLAYMDMKTDLGLLFLLLVSLLLLVYWIQVSRSQEIVDISTTEISGVPTSKKTSKKGKTGKKPARRGNLQEKGVFFNRLHMIANKLNPEQQILVILGLLLGFALGIKISAVMVVFPLIAILWYVAGGLKAFFATVGLGLFFVLAAGLDDQAGLGDLHLTASVVQWTMFAGGVVALLYFGLTQRQVFILLLKKSAILILCISIPMMPWLVKNYSESRSLSVRGLTQGRTSQPVVTLEKLRHISPPVKKPGE